MKLKTEHFSLTFDNGEIHLTTHEDRRVYVNRKLFNGPAKPKKEWVVIKTGIIKKGDKVSKGDYCEFARGLIGANAAVATAAGWTIRRKIETS